MAARRAPIGQLRLRARMAPAARMREAYAAWQPAPTPKPLRLSILKTCLSYPTSATPEVSISNLRPRFMCGQFAAIHWIYVGLVSAACEKHAPDRPTIHYDGLNQVEGSC